MFKVNHTVFDVGKVPFFGKRWNNPVTFRRCWMMSGYNNGGGVKKAEWSGGGVKFAAVTYLTKFQFEFAIHDFVHSQKGLNATMRASRKRN